MESCHLLDYSGSIPAFGSSALSLASNPTPLMVQSWSSTKPVVMLDLTQGEMLTLILVLLSVIHTSSVPGPLVDLRASVAAPLDAHVA